MEAFPEPLAFGPYQLHAKIAQGGMAEVLLGMSEKRAFDGEFLAIKKLLPHLNANKPFVNLLVHEAKIGVLLNHPGIVSVYDLGSHRSEFFLAMEYVHGKSLDRILERIQKKLSPRLSIELSTFIIMELLRALAFAHELKDNQERELNIIHRDISPGNILLGYRGEVKLTDFGIATAEHRLQPGFTQAALGKLSYMAPEQAVNDPVQRASDIYSLSVVFYELLTGQLPFQADSPAALYRKVVDGKMADLKITGPAISDGLRAIVTKGLNRSAKKRFQSAPEMFEVIADYFKSEHEIDFTSRTVRQYFRKKLTEALRASFEKEIVEEIMVIQSAMKYSNQIEFKSTAPIDLRKGLPTAEDVANEATVFQRDTSDEPTRHYPLSQEERKQILEGVSPKEVLAKASPSSQKYLSSHKTSEELPRLDLPASEEDDDPELLRRTIPVEQKILLSALDRDSKEALKHHKPKLEIASQAQLNSFEETTFSGVGKRKKVAIELPEENPNEENNEVTRGRNGSQVLEELEKLRTGETEIESDSSIDKTENISFSLESIAFVERLKRMAENLPRLIPSIRGLNRNSFRKYAIVALFVCLATIIWFASTQVHEIGFLPHHGLLPIQRISIVFIGEASQKSESKLFNSMEYPGPFPSIQRVEDFFNREFTRYTEQPGPVLKIDANPPLVVGHPLSKESAMAEYFKSNKIFRFLNQLKDNPKTPSESQTKPDSLIYIYLLPFDRVHQGNSAQADLLEWNHKLQQSSSMLSSRPKEAVIFGISHPSKRLEILEDLAEEIASLYGAKFKIEKGSGKLQLPIGLADPQQNPLYPQTQAELMARDIALSTTQTRPILGISELAIGPETAFELGWIDEVRKADLLRQK